MRRLYVQSGVYFLSWNTKNRYPFFEEDIFCNILCDAIFYCRQIKPFRLIGYKINPDHIHVILEPTGAHNISQIVQNIKRISNEHINQVIFCHHDENPFAHLEWTENLRHCSVMFFRKYNQNKYHPFPRFQWQKSFHDRLIRSPRELQNCRNYLKKQSQKHLLQDNHFLYLN